MEANALALLLLSSAGATPATNALVQKLAAFVAQGPARGRFGPLFVSTGAFGGALAARALSAYDAAAGSAQPQLQLNATAVAPRVGVGGNGTSAVQLQQQQKQLQPVQLLSASFTPANAGALKAAAANWARLPPNASLEFTARGRGEASVAASLSFVPAELLGFPTYRGLYVQRAILLDAAAAAGGGAAANKSAATAAARGASGAAVAVAAAPLASVVTVAVQVTTPDDLSDVVVEAWMPGGLEPLDPNVYPDPDFATTCRQSEDEGDLAAGSSSPGFGGGVVGGGVVAAMPTAPPPRPRPASISMAAAAPGRGRRLAAAAAASSAPPRWGIWPPWWPACPAQETLPAAVVFRYARMRAGAHTIRFKAIAATPGTFVLPPVKAYASRQPEVMGLSAAGKFVVCGARSGGGGAQCDTRALPPAAPPKACPRGCSGNGACVVATGVCACDAGFSGADCSAFAAV